MEKILVKINEKLIDVKLAQDVLTSSGILIVPEDTVITDHILKKLYDFKIEDVVVYKPEKAVDIADSMQVNTYELYYKEYSKDVNELKGVLQEIAAGKKLDYSRVDKISKNIYYKINNCFSFIECIKAVKSVDEYTYTHSVNVSVYSMLIGKWLNFSDNQLMDIILAGLLHDVGKAKIPLEILNKKGPLTYDEFEIIKKHALYGYEIVKDHDEISNEVKKAILTHHEKENGKGYPMGLKGDQKNLYAKIITVADVFDAITTVRVYKDKKTPFDAFKELEAVGYDALDPQILMVLFKNLPSYYVGSKVKMNSGELGEVVYVPSQCIYAPVVRLEDEQFLDISKCQDKSIKEFI